MQKYIKEQKTILKQLCVWGKIPQEDKMRFKSCINEIQVDNMMAKFRRNYL